MKRRGLTALAVLACVATSASPAIGAAKGESLDELRATDAEIVKAIAELDKQVAAQQNEVSSAQQAYDAAVQAVVATEARLASTRQKIDSLQTILRDRAVEQYMQPTDDQVTRLLSADGFSEASRRDELLKQITNDNSDAVDQMRAARIDLDAELKQSADAKELAEKRRTAAQKKLDELKAKRDEHAKAEAVLRDRIAAATEEDQASGWGGVDDGRISASGVRWPIHGNHPVTSSFGPRWGRLHAGIDVGIPVGTPVFAAKEGTVTFSGPSSGYGNYICIQHDGGFMTCYGHLSRFQVSVGQSVTQDTEIAKSGNTGHSTGAHLHFETCASNGQPACYYAKRYANPMNYLP